MRKYLIPILFLLALFSCQRTPVEKKLRELDAVIAQRHYYIEAFEIELQLMKDSLALCDSDSSRWERFRAIESKYETFNLDSAWLYARYMRQINGKTHRQVFDTQIASILVDIRMDNLNSALYRLEAVDYDSLDLEEKGRYHKMMSYYYAKMLNRSILNPDIEMYRRLSKEEDLKAMEFGTDDPVYNAQVRVEKMDEAENESALEYLLECYASIDDLHNLSKFAYEISKEYDNLGSPAKARFWLIQSSIHALKSPLRTYESFDDLVQALYKEGDIRRAAKYMDVVIDDALKANFQYKVVTSVRSLMLIDAQNDYRDMMLKRLTYAIIGLISILLIVVFTAFMLTVKQTRKLQESYGVISELSKIKEGYVFNYMKLSVDYLGKVEDYRHELRLALKEGGPDAVAMMLRRPSKISEEYKKFYMVFDETFMNIFPDFVEKVNALLQPSAAFELDENGAMPTGLRILAALRLGFENSGKIAQFLNCAPSSVYTHRSKIKAKSIVDPEKFEELIRKIS